MTRKHHETFEVVSPRPDPAIKRRTAMSDFLYFFLFLAAWFVIQRWVFPSLGIPT